MRGLCLSEPERGSARAKRFTNHAFVTAQGSAATRYRRAIETRSLFPAELAAREMGHLPLRTRLGCSSYMRLRRDRDTSRDVALHDLQLAPAALQALPSRSASALSVLREIAESAPGSIPDRTALR